MYQTTDVVVHPGAGVCRIEDVRTESFAREARQYYVLRPLYENENTTIYVPVDSDKIHLRRLLSKKEILTLIRGVSLDAPLWVENPSQRRDTFAELLRQDDPATLIRLIAELHCHREQAEKSGRKFHAADEKVLQEASRRIHQEFAHALDLSMAEIAPFIRRELGL